MTVRIHTIRKAVRLYLQPYFEPKAPWKVVERFAQAINKEVKIIKPKHIPTYTVMRMMELYKPE